MLDPDKITNKILDGKRINNVEAMELYNKASLHQLANIANALREKIHPDGVVTYVVDRNINYTNICTSRCKFCAFYKDKDSPDAYVLEKEKIFEKIEETIALGGTGILMQGGLNPDLDINFFEDLLRSIRKNYKIDLHCFSPPEISYISKISAISIKECLSRLMEAGMSSLPGGGAEILSDEIRTYVSPNKCTTNQWLRVMETAHNLGLKTTATMMFGYGEELHNRIEHLSHIRTLQDRTGGFVSFIPWTFQWRNTELGKNGWPRSATAVEYLKMVALSRIYLDNFRTVQASWVTQGLKMAQITLCWGANDVGSVMIEENVVAAAGTSFKTNESELRRIITDAGFTPKKRNNIHEVIEH